MANVDIPDEVATARDQLSGKERTLLDNFFERGAEDTRSRDTETVVEKLLEYRDEIETAAEIAKNQFSQPLGGMNPDSGEFAVRRPQAGFFGFDSWEGQLTSLTAGAVVDWIDDFNADNLGGTDPGDSFGSPLKVGDEAVHVITGVGTYSSSPKINSVEWEVNEEPRSIVQTKYEWTLTDVGIKWLDRALILPENALFEAKVFPDVAGDDAPFLTGVSYIKHRASQIQDPANMTDDTTSTSDNIVAQG